MEVACNLLSIEEAIKTMGQKAKEAWARKDRRAYDKINREIRAAKAAKAEIKKALMDLAKAQAKIQKNRASALKKIGSYDMSTKELAALHPGEARTHIDLLMNRATTQQKRRFEHLYRLLHATPDPSAYPLLSKVFGKQNKKGEWVLLKNLNIDGKHTNKRGEAIGETVSTGDLLRQAQGIPFDHGIYLEPMTRGWRVKDRKTGREVDAVDVPDALWKAEKFFGERLKDPNFDPMGMPVTNVEGPRKSAVYHDTLIGTDGKPLRVTEGTGRVGPRPSVEAELGYKMMLFRRGKEFWNTADKLINHARKRMGLEEVDIKGQWDAVTGGLMEAASRVSQYNKDIQTLVKKYKISMDPRDIARRYNARALIDARMEKFRMANKDKPNYSELAAKEYELVKAEIYARTALKPEERQYLNEWDRILDQVAKEIEIPVEDIRYGFLSRVKTTRDLIHDARNAQFKDVLGRDETVGGTASAQLRQKGEFSKNKELMAAIEKGDLEMLLKLGVNPNFEETMMNYINNVINARYTGEQAMRLKSLFAEGDTGFLMAGVEVSGQGWGQNFIKRAQRELEVLTRKPSADSALSREKALGQNKKVIEKLETLRDVVNGIPIINKLSPALTNRLNAMKFKINSNQVQSLWELWASLMRARQFGVAPMASARDMASTGMLIGMRTDTGSFSRAVKDTWVDLVFNFPKWKKEYERQVRMGTLKRIGDQVALPELDGATSYKGFRAMLEKLQRPYQFTDTLTRMLSNRSAELSHQKAFKRFMKSKRTTADEVRYLQDTYMDMAPSQSARGLKKLLREASKTGNDIDLRDRVIKIQQGETAFMYERWNSSPYMDTAGGRAFGQFGSWSLNAISAAGHMATSPWKLYGKSHPQMAALRQAKMMAKFGIAAEALYSLGGMFGVDTTSWIPFTHTWMFAGGPVLEPLGRVAGLATGDPREMAQLDAGLAKYTWSLGRDFVPGFPIPGTPKTIERGLGQFMPEMDIPGEETVRSFLPPVQSSFERRAMVTMGFHPNQGVYEGQVYTEGGVLGKINAATFGRAQDSFSEWSNGWLRPGTEEGGASDYGGIWD